MAMKHIRMATGSMAETSREARRFISMRMTTMMVMSTSSVRASSKVPMVSLMSCVRS